MSSVTPSARAEYGAFMHRLADSAATIAQSYFSQKVGYELKLDASPVTIADKEIEMEIVAQIRSTYPDHGIFGEETARINPNAPLQWVIDPIDGTKAFIAGKPTFVTLIALCEHGHPRLGLISQPISNKRWLSCELHSQEPEATTLADAHIATTSIPYFSATEMNAFRQLEKESATTLLNMDGLAAGMLADGNLDVLLEAGLKPYDFAALVPVIEAAGGTVTDWQGQPLTLASKGHLLATRDKTLHKQVLELLTSGSL